MSAAVVCLCDGQGYLMKQVRDERTRASRWQPYYFRLDGAFLAHYDQKSLVEARESEVGRGGWVGGGSEGK